jgi:hypothetical protein
MQMEAENTAKRIAYIIVEGAVVSIGLASTLYVMAKLDATVAQAALGMFCVLALSAALAQVKDRRIAKCETDLARLLYKKHLEKEQKEQSDVSTQEEEDTAIMIPDPRACRTCESYERYGSSINTIYRGECTDLDMGVRNPHKVLKGCRGWIPIVDDITKKGE